MSGTEAALYSLLGLDRANTSWMDWALCAQEDPDIWFPVKWNSGGPADDRATYAEQVQRAIEICLDCPVRAQCLADAESRNEQNGIWGGQDFYVPKGRRPSQRAAQRAKAS